MDVRFHTPHGVVHAVEGVSLQVRAGEVVAVVGESGSGKTVLTRRVMGLIGEGRGTEVVRHRRLRRHADLRTCPAGRCPRSGVRRSR